METNTKEPNKKQTIQYKDASQNIITDSLIHSRDRSITNKNYKQLNLCWTVESCIKLEFHVQSEYRGYINTIGTDSKMQQVITFTLIT